MLRKMIAAAGLALLLGWLSPAMAQSNNILIVASCGNQTFTATLNNLGILTEDTTGKLCVNATVSATVGGFQPNGAYGTLTATAASSASTALPTGATVRITNLGASAIVSCTFATGAATGLVSNLTIPPLSSVSRVVGTFDHIACIDQTGSTGSNLVVLEGGSGLGNDSGGAGGGGLGITPTDHTITSTSGSSQQIMAANAGRHSITIENTGNANCGINPTGGTAVIGGAGTITLAALGSYTPRVPTLSAVNVICTAGQPIYADDN